jgi:hypothetical protein
MSILGGLIFLFDVSDLRCSMISFARNNKPVLFCISPRSDTNESSAVVNLFELNDQLQEIHFPGSDSIHKIQLIEYIDKGEPVIWYALQLKGYSTDIPGFTTNVGVEIGHISASEAKSVRISNGFGFSGEIFEELDRLWDVFAIRRQISDNSLNVLLLQSLSSRAYICNFFYKDLPAYKDNEVKSVQNCTYLKNLFYYIKDFVGGSAPQSPYESLEPPRTLFVRGKYLKDGKLIEIWVIYAVAQYLNPSNLSPAIGHLLLSVYDIDGNHITNIAHNTAEEVKLSRQYPSGLAVANTDSFFVWFSGRDGSSCIAQYLFEVCFDGESNNCSPLIFE